MVSHEQLTKSIINNMRRRSIFLAKLSDALRVDVVCVHYAGKKEYKKIRESGPYTEESLLGVTLLSQHSFEPLDSMVIIKTPEWEEK